MATEIGTTGFRTADRPVRAVAFVCGVTLGVLVWLLEFADTGTSDFAFLQPTLGIAGVVCIAFATYLWSRIPRLSRVVARFCIPVVSVLFLWGVIEAISWVVLETSEPATHIGRWEFRSQKPAPYQDAPYFSPEFLRESMVGVRSLTVPSGRNYTLPGDVQGKYFNVKDGQRRTTDRPAAASRRVLVFGASTVFCQETPDRWTLPSCLQREINRRSSEACRVENHSSVTMIALQQTARLRDTPISKKL